MFILGPTTYNSRISGASIFNENSRKNGSNTYNGRSIVQRATMALEKNIKMAPKGCYEFRE